MFAIFDPNELPIAISGFEFITEDMLTKTSGIDVPRATTVIPSNMSLTPSFFPNFDTFVINISAPLTRKINPKMSNKEGKRNSIVKCLPLVHICNVRSFCSELEVTQRLNNLSFFLLRSVSKNHHLCKE